jgi:hypothetical protein
VIERPIGRHIPCTAVEDIRRRQYWQRADDSDRGDGPNEDLAFPAMRSRYEREQTSIHQVFFKNFPKQKPKAKRPALPSKQQALLLRHFT